MNDSFPTQIAKLKINLHFTLELQHMPGFTWPGSQRSSDKMQHCNGHVNRTHFSLKCQNNRKIEDPK
jgi:hypothetical protein